ncbi:MAG: NADPH-dependent F420 reductase [Anaerolineales bacterium]|jgi:NADPH-dependent F420 reductase
MTDRLIFTISIVGGTGKQGPGLAYRWAKAGYHVIVGSRDRQKAEATAAKLNERLGREAVLGMENSDAVKSSDVVTLTIPYSAHQKTLESLKDVIQGKIVIDVTVPIKPPAIDEVFVPEAGSASQEAQVLLGENVRVVAAFQNVSYTHLIEDSPVPCDVLVCGDSQEARKLVLELVKAAGLVGWDAGPLKNAVVVEGLTPILLGINKKYDIKHAGLRIFGDQPTG